MPSVTVRLAVAVALVGALAVPLRAAEPAAGSFDRNVARRIKPEELQQRRTHGEKAIILDTRGVPTDVTARGAVHVPNDRIEAWAKDVPKDAFIVAYCT
jgi:hypothetical protein